MVGLLGRVISSSQGLYLNTGQHKHRINTYTYQTFMPCVGFEPTIAASKRAKTVHALDRSSTVTGTLHITLIYFLVYWKSTKYYSLTTNFLVYTEKQCNIGCVNKFRGLDITGVEEPIHSCTLLLGNFVGTYVCRLLITPRYRVTVKLTVVQPLKNFPVFYEILKL
jgi:hypothetical protein